MGTPLLHPPSRLQSAPLARHAFDETSGAVAAPLTLEPPRGYGLPRVLALMAPWQADALLAGLVHGGVLEAHEADAAADAAAAFQARGGLWARGAGAGDGVPVQLGRFQEEEEEDGGEDASATPAPSRPSPPSPTLPPRPDMGLGPPSLTSG